MKQVFFILVIVIFMAGLSQTLLAQKEVSIFNKNTVKEMYRADSVYMMFNENRGNDIRIKAVRDFIKSYKDITNVEWYAVEDGFIAKFKEEGIETKVQYDAAGNRKNILRSYDEAHMQPEIRDIVKREYYDYNIVVVYEVEHSNGLIYIIKIMDKTNLKVLQIVNNEMQVLENYVKG